MSLLVARCISNRTQSYFAVKCSGFFIGSANNAMHGNGRLKNQSKSQSHDLKVLTRLFWCLVAGLVEGGSWTFHLASRHETCLVNFFFRRVVGRIKNFR